jgi:uncharacterized DUF497 family protein
MRFAWDARKALQNAKKHAVTFDEAVSVFCDALAATVPDPDHSIGELRFLTVGYSSSGKLMVVAHTEDDNDTIRIISAREATRHERKDYEG